MRHQFEPENVRRVFIKPQTFHNNVAFRFEFYGCTMSEFIKSQNLCDIAIKNKFSFSIQFLKNNKNLCSKLEKIVHHNFYIERSCCGKSCCGKVRENKHSARAFARLLHNF